MKKSKSKIRLKQLIKDSLKDALNTGWLDFQLTNHDSHLSLNDVISLKWYFTIFMLFVQMVFGKDLQNGRKK